MRPITKRLIDCLVLDLCPDQTVCIDFGIPVAGDPNPQFGALQWGYRNEVFSGHELDWALGNGPRLTELVNKKDSYGRDNPHKCNIHTMYDGFLDEEEEEI